jgi:hypothetical protein
MEEHHHRHHLQLLLFLLILVAQPRAAIQSCSLIAIGMSRAVPAAAEKAALLHWRLLHKVALSASEEGDYLPSLSQAGPNYQGLPHMQKGHRCTTTTPCTQ